MSKLDDLNRDIMNLLTKTDEDLKALLKVDDGVRYSFKLVGLDDKLLAALIHVYKMGHRDARHAAMDRVVKAFVDEKKVLPVDVEKPTGTVVPESLSKPLSYKEKRS